MTTADNCGWADESDWRTLIPQVLAGLVRRGEDFDAAEDALQEALIEALRAWPEHPRRSPRAWLTTVTTRRLIDVRRSETSRTRREDATYVAPQPGACEVGDDTLFLLFCCCHPDLTPTSQVALTLRAVGGLTTAEIAGAFYVPEKTMAQRISRAKRTLRGRHLDEPGEPRGRVARALPRLHRRARRPGRSRRRSDPPLPSTAESSASTDRTAPAGTPARSPKASGSSSRRWPDSDRAATRSRPPSPPRTTTPPAPKRPTGRRSWRGTTNSSPSPTTRSTRIPPRRSRGPSQSVTSAGPQPDWTRSSGCERCSASGTGGTPCAATSMNSAATCPSQPRRTPMPPTAPPTSPSETT